MKKKKAPASDTPVPVCSSPSACPGLLPWAETGSSQRPVLGKGWNLRAGSHRRRETRGWGLCAGWLGTLWKVKSWDIWLSYWPMGRETGASIHPQQGRDEEMKGLHVLVRRQDKQRCSAPRWEEPGLALQAAGDQTFSLLGRNHRPHLCPNRHLSSICA